MKKLKSIIRYECMTSFKYIWIFYAIQYAAVSLITLIIGISTGSFEEVGTNSLEVNTLVYVGILGVLGFKEDFKMLIQNGFTRKYIYTATFSMFLSLIHISSFQKLSLWQFRMLKIYSAVIKGLCNSFLMGSSMSAYS